MPLDVFHQKSNEPYFMNAMVFYDLLCNSLKCLGPEPALSVCFHPLLKEALLFATEVILWEKNRAMMDGS